MLLSQLRKLNYRDIAGEFHWPSDNAFILLICGSCVQLTRTAVSSHHVQLTILGADGQGDGEDGDTPDTRCPHSLRLTIGSSHKRLFL